MKKIILAIILSISVITIFQTTAYADMGPKDHLTVYIKNPPNELYYLDLLTQVPGEYSNISNNEKALLNQDMVTLLHSHENDNWFPALAGGTKIPMRGKLTGKADGNKMVHSFGYHGLPGTYRIIIVTKSGKISVSDIYTRNALQSSITYDYNTGKGIVPPILLTYLIQFLMTFSFTIIIEGVILLLFGFKLKENLKVFLLTNFLTQILLTITLGFFLINEGPTFAFIVLFPVEIVILFAETLSYKRYLLGESNKRKIAYAIVANIASCAAGLFLLDYLFMFLTKLS